MALPKIDRPTQRVKLPVSGKSGKITPFTIKEQKALLLAEKSDNEKDIIDAISNSIRACSDFKPEELSIVDFQYLFLQIRKLSVGAYVDVNLQCSCGAETQAKLNLNEYKVKMPDGDIEDKIMINDTIGISLKYPSVKDTLESNDEYGITTLIDYVFDADNVYNLSDFSKEEVQDFIDSIPVNVLEKISNFTDNLPDFYLEKKWKCPACKKENDITIHGLSAFFG